MSSLSDAQTIESEVSDSVSYKEALSQFKKLISDINITILVKNVVQNLLYYPKYSALMQKNSNLCREIQEPRKQLNVDQSEIKLFLKYALFFKILYKSNSVLEEVNSELDKLDCEQKELLPEYEPFGVEEFLVYNLKEKSIIDPIYVAFEYENQIYIIIRGTYSINDLLSDSFCHYESSMLCDIEVHAGFLQGAEEIYAEISDMVVDRNVILIGHSYGGAISAVLTFLFNETKIVKSVKCVTFGCPPCFSREMMDRELDITSFIVEDDPIPHISIFGLSIFECRLDMERKKVTSVYTAEELISRQLVELKNPLFVPGSIIQLCNSNYEILFYESSKEYYYELVFYDFMRNLDYHGQYLEYLYWSLCPPLESIYNNCYLNKSEETKLLFNLK